MTADKQEERLYMLLDASNNPLAQGILEEAPPGSGLCVEVLDNKADDVAAQPVIHLIAARTGDQSYKCQVVRQRGERVLLKVSGVLDQDVRRNLRVPVRFDSFLYPLTGSWRGRRAVQTLDLSCGGVAFFGEPGLELKEEMEIVVPALEGPVILRCHILRIKEMEDGRWLYATKFVDMCEDEEVTVREAVFFLQLQNHGRSANTSRPGR